MSRYIRLISVLLAAAFISVGLAVAQAGEIGYGDAITGTLDDASPEHTYTFTAAEGDVITIAHTVTSGDLDPLLILADESGAFITQDDDSGEGRSSLIRDFVVPADGTYRIIATRYDRANGDTSGDYTLTLSAAGQPDEAPTPTTPDDEFGALPDLGDVDYTMLADGDSADGDITGELWGMAYVFGGHAGDEVSIDVTRTDGDLVLRVDLLDQAGLMDSTGESALAAAEDSDEAGAVNMTHTLTETAYYVIGVGRVGGVDGTTAGSYTIALAITGEAGEAVEATEEPEATEEVQPDVVDVVPAIEITLSWNTTADLDLVLQYFPAEGEGELIAIDWHNVEYPEDYPLPEGVTFDVDANRFCRDLSEQPRETITWAADTAPAGSYEILVMYSSPCEGTVTPVEFELTYAIDGAAQTVSGTMAEPRVEEYRVTFAR